MVGPVNYCCILLSDSWVTSSGLIKMDKLISSNSIVANCHVMVAILTVAYNKVKEQDHQFYISLYHITCFYSKCDGIYPKVYYSTL